jgi:CheY-like chemotaxis protein
MDIAMPSMDGITATRAIRMLSQDNLSQVPIICLTAHINSYLQEALDAGCNEVVGKPINLTTLQPLVQQYLATLMLLMINILCGYVMLA